MTSPEITQPPTKMIAPPKKRGSSVVNVVRNMSSSTAFETTHTPKVEKGVGRIKSGSKKRSRSRSQGKALTPKARRGAAKTMTMEEIDEKSEEELRK